MQPFKYVREYIIADPENSNRVCIDKMKRKLQNYLDTDLIKLRIDKYNELLGNLSLDDFSLKNKSTLSTSLAFIFPIINTNANKSPPDLYNDINEVNSNLQSASNSRNQKMDEIEKEIEYLSSLNFRIISRKIGHHKIITSAEKDKRQTETIIFPFFKDISWNKENANVMKSLTNISKERIVLLKFSDDDKNHTHINKRSVKRLHMDLNANHPDCIVCQSIDILDFFYIKHLLTIKGVTK